MLRFILIIGFILSFSSIVSSKTLDNKIFETIESLPRPWYPPNVTLPETDEERSDRVRMISRIIYEESMDSSDKGWYWDDNSLAWAVMVKTWFESGRYRHGVHTGRLRGDNGRSVCLGQIMNGGNRLVGTSEENTRNCIQKVVKFLIQHQNRCLKDTSKATQWNISVIFAGYGTGHSCNGNIYTKNGDKKYYWARQRAWMWNKMISKYN